MNIEKRQWIIFVGFMLTGSMMSSCLGFTQTFHRMDGPDEMIVSHKPDGGVFENEQIGAVEEITGWQTPVVGSTADPVIALAESQVIDGADCVPQKQPLVAEAVRVVDGDTIVIEVGGERYKVRYIGIDTPEMARTGTPAEYFADEATRKNVELVEGKQVYLFPDVSDTDQYGRKLFYVFVDDGFVNYQLVKEGYARFVTFPPDVACVNTFRNAESHARESGIGLWGED